MSGTEKKLHTRNSQVRKRLSKWVVDFYTQSASESLQRTIRASITENSSVQFKMVSMLPENPICAPPRLLEVSLTLPLKRFQCSSDSGTVVFKHIFWTRISRQLYKIQSINGEDICSLQNPAPHLHSTLEIKPLQSEHWSSAYCRQFPSTLGDGAQVTCDSRERHSVTCAEHDSEIESLRHGWDELVWN